MAQVNITVTDIRSAEKIISLHFTEAIEDPLAVSVKSRNLSQQGFIKLNSKQSNVQNPPAFGTIY